MKLNLMGHYENHSGYGRFGVQTKKALEACGVEILPDIGFEPQGYQHILNEPVAQRGLERGDIELARVALWLSTPPHIRGWYEGQFATIFTMWESTEIPPAFRQNLSHFDRVFVPSLQNQELYGRFHPDVRYIPLGIDESWGYVQRPPVLRDFNFLTAGFGPRKGAHQVLEAFQRVFPGGKPLTKGGAIPQLTIRSREEFHAPNVRVIAVDLSAQAELDLYANSHCYVSGSKGEGFGFMPLQAICQGLPTILGNAHGHAAYAHYGIPIGTHPLTCKSATFWGDGGEWWEPNFDEMCEAMEDVYLDYHKHEEFAAARSFLAAQEFTWEKTAEQILVNLDDQIYLPGPIDREWHKAPPKLFHVRVNKPCDYVVNGTMNHFVPGQDYYEAADLKRAIIAAGHLDIATFDPNDLGVEDNADIEMLRARNAICSTCHQPYNRDTSLLELMGAP